MKLMKSQRQAIWDNIAAYGELDPTEFQWLPVSDERHAILVAPEPGFRFGIEERPDDDYNVAFAPGHSTPSESRTRLLWSEVMQQLDSWLEYVIREREAVDPWEARDAIADLIHEAATPGPADDEPISPQEQDRLGQAVAVIEAAVRQLIVEQASANEQLLLYSARQFAQLGPAAAVTTRGRWRQLLHDVVANVLATISIQIGSAPVHGVLDIVRSMPL